MYAVYVVFKVKADSKLEAEDNVGKMLDSIPGYALEQLDYLFLEKTEDEGEV